MFGKKKKNKGQKLDSQVIGGTTEVIKDPVDTDGPFTIRYKTGKYIRSIYNNYSTFKEADLELTQIKNGIENRNFHILSVYNSYDTFWIEDRLGNKYHIYERSEMVKADKDKKDQRVSKCIREIEELTGKKVELK